MEVKNYSHNGRWFREIISRQYCALQELGGEYKKLGNKVWVNLYDACNGLWVLTIEMKEAA